MNEAYTLTTLALGIGGCLWLFVYLFPEVWRDEFRFKIVKTRWELFDAMLQGGNNFDDERYRKTLRMLDQTYAAVDQISLPALLVAAILVYFFQKVEVEETPTDAVGILCLRARATVVLHLLTFLFWRGLTGWIAWLLWHTFRAYSWWGRLSIRVRGAASEVVAHPSLFTPRNSGFRFTKTAS